MDVLDIAAFCLEQQGPLGAMKLQKLIYYCQAWHLVAFLERLFPEDIQAWAYGPVVYELYQQHRGQFVVSELKGEPSRVRQFPHSYQLIVSVLSHYGKLNGSILSEMTHRESPWLEARYTNDGPYAQEVITLASMQQFYCSQQPPFPLPSRKTITTR